MTKNGKMTLVWHVAVGPPVARPTARARSSGARSSGRRRPRPPDVGNPKATPWQANWRSPEEGASAGAPASRGSTSRRMHRGRNAAPRWLIGGRVGSPAHALKCDAVLVGPGVG
eukprot:9089606-Pyramimonas_sp.AAC.1